MLAWSERKLAVYRCATEGQKPGRNCIDSLLSGLFWFLAGSLVRIKLEVLIVNRNWIKVFVAAFLEVFWVIGLTHAFDFWTWTGTAIAIVVSNYLMITAAQVLPAGTVYAVFVGLGTAGTVISDILFFGDPFKWEKIILIIILLAGVIGLQLVTSDKVKEGAES